MRYLWAWDLDRIGGVSVRLTFDGHGPLDVEMTGTRHAHIELSAGGFTYGRFSTALEAAINAAVASTPSLGVHGFTGVDVAFSASAGYSIQGRAADVRFGLTFLGEAGTRMRRIVGFQGNRDWATLPGTGIYTWVSDARPIYVIIPAIEARSSRSDEYEPDGLAAESTSDDGEEDVIAVETSAIWEDWTQAAEVDVAHTGALAPGTPVHARFESAAVPWSYQSAWKHARAGNMPFMIDGEVVGEQPVYTLRAEGMSFRPTRFAAQDINLWSLGFKARLKDI